jgi:hypothetical protein
MPEYFDFAYTDMSTTPIWVIFPNLPLKCWFSTCLSKIASVIGKPLQCDTPTTTMSRLSFARVLIEVDLFSDLPNSINILLPNRVPLLQPIIYESLPKFCKHYRLLGHTITICSKAVATRGKEIQTTVIPDRASRSPVHHPPSFGHNVKTTAVEDQQGYQDMPHGEQSLDPMCAEVEVVADGWAIICGKKKVRLTSTNEKRDQDITFHMQNQGIVPFMNPLPLCI